MRPSMVSRFSTKLPLPSGRPVRSCLCIFTISSPFRHQVSVCLIIRIVKEVFLPTISTLRYVVGKTRSHYSCNSCHKRKVYWGVIMSRNKYDVPRIPGSGFTVQRFKVHRSPVQGWIFSGWVIWFTRIGRLWYV